MCYDVSEQSTLWLVVQRTARKRHACELCRLPIAVGVVYEEVSSLDDHRWTRWRVHHDCHALTRWIRFTVCDQDLYTIAPGDLREEVNEHREYPEVISRYRLVLRARIREGVWPVRRAA